MMNSLHACRLAGFLGLVAAGIFLILQANSFADKSTVRLTPPQYPVSCDTTILPAGFREAEVTSTLPYDLESLHSTPGAEPPVSSDCSVFETQKKYDLFSWETFIALNWPADDKGNPVTGEIGTKPTAARVWEHYLEPQQIFKAGGAAPDAWGTPQKVPGSATGNTGNTEKVLWSASKTTHVLNEVDEAFFNLETAQPPIVDLNNAYARYEIRINKSEYEYIVSNKLYSKSGQQTFISAGNTVSFPTGQGGTTPVRGAMELKAAWKKLGANDDASKFYTTTASVYRPYETPQWVTGETYGLVGLHIMVRIKGAPQWVWATFEHVDNAPEVNLADGIPPQIGGQGKTYNFWSYQDGQGSIAGFNPASYQAMKKVQNGDNYYQPESQRIPSQITKVITDNNQVAVSKWTKHLNATMQKKLKKTVWKNYRLISTQHPTDPSAGGTGNPAPVSLGNPVMETYLQVNGSCMGCHVGATYGGPDKKAQDANFSFMLQRAQ